MTTTTHTNAELDTLQRLNEQERRDYPRFFELLKIIGDIGEKAADDPACNDLFVELLHCAPPRYKQEAESILSEALPPATHVNEEGQAVFSVEQIAEHFGETPEKVAADIADLEARGLLTGSSVDPQNIHPIQ